MEYLPSLIILGLTVGIASNLFNSWKTISNLPKSLPWAGRRPEVCSRVRACLRELFAGSASLRSGYDQCNRKGQSFVVPDPGFRPQVMVPQEYLGWLIEQPEDVLAARPPQVRRFAVSYLAPTLDFSHDMYMMDVVRKDLTRNLGRLQADIFNDLRESIDALLGLDDESWREIRIFETMEKIVFKSTNRVFVGLPLCHDEGFLQSSAAFAQWLGAGAVIVGQLMPSILKPLFGYLIAIPVYVAQIRSFRYLVPAFRERMENIRRKRIDPSFIFDEPKDMITWMVTAALENQDTKASRPEAMAERMLFFMLAAIHTTILTGTNIFLDLLSCPLEFEYYTTLRSEAAAVFKTEEDRSDHTSLGKLVFADSAIRETLRKNPVLTRVVLREVVRKEGLDTPDGHHLPQGAWVGAPVVSLHHDERSYPRPDVYDPFRFAPKTAAKQAETATTTTPMALKSRKPQGLSTTSDTYLAFGYGRHSCPGRWFVAHQLKLLLAYVVLHYDIQPLEQRPLNRIFGDSIIPSQSATMKVRRRRAI